MSRASKSRSKSINKTKSQTEQIERNEQNEELQDEEMDSGDMLDTVTTTPTVLRRYKMPYRNFLRDFKIQMQNENLSNKDLIKLASQHWKNMTLAEKEPYIREATYAKELDAQNPKKNTRQQPTKRKRKCPKCGGYPASSSPSEQSTSETTEAANTESEESEEDNKEDYSTDSSCYSCSTETNASEQKTGETGNPNKDAAKQSNRRKKRTKKARRNVKRRKQYNSSSGSASYCENSSDNAITSDTAIISNVSNCTSASI